MLEHAVDGALVLTFLDGLALVVLLLASGDGNDQLGEPALVDEQAQRDNREAGLLGLAGNAAYLLAVEQELTVAMGGVVVVGAVAVLGNIHVLGPHLAIDDNAIGIGKSYLALTDGLDLGAGEDNACGERLYDLVIKGRSPVLDVDIVGVVVILIGCHSVTE